MKKLSLQLFVILIVCFVVIVAIQYWHQDSLFKQWLDKDFKENGRMIFNDILRRETISGAEKKQVARQTALIFARLLVQPAESPENDLAPLQPVSLPDRRRGDGPGDSHPRHRRICQPRPGPSPPACPR